MGIKPTTIGMSSPRRRTCVDEMEVAGIVEEILCHGGVRPGFDFPDEVVDIGLQAGRLGMPFGVTADEDVELAAALDERDELAGVAETAGRERNCCAFGVDGDVASERENPCETCVLELCQMCINRVARLGDTGEMGHDVRRKHALDGEACFQSSNVAAAAGPERYGGEIRFELGQIRGGLFELVPACRGLRREELERDMGWLTRDEGALR